MKTYFNSHGSEDSTWKIVYMDMITLLMILFLSLWVIDKGKSKVQPGTGNITLNKVEIEADEYFDPGKSEVKASAKEKLKELFFGQNRAFPAPGLDPAAGGRRVILLHGHTDDQGVKRENFQLGFERAMSVFEELQRNVPTLADNVGICSYADNFPAQSILTADRGMSAEQRTFQADENRRRRQKNRRFEIIGQFEDLQQP